MSGIFGCWQLAGQPLNAAALAPCIAGLQPQGQTGATPWIVGPLALAGRSSRAAPGSVTELLGLPGNNPACVFDGRLDNRDELALTLSDHPLVGSACEDCDLVAAAYERFGDTFVEHLDGDFSLAVFDRRMNRLLIARDRLGLRPLCYARIHETFLFASNAKAILAYPGIKAVPDEAMLADFVLSFISSDAETRTFFADIHSLPAAHVLIVTPEGTVLRRYFEFDTRRQVRLSAWPDYVGAFHQLFVDSVRRRLRSVTPVAIAVSGGLDSAYIFCVARGLVRDARAACPAVLGFNYAGLPGTPSDESDFVDRLEQACGVRIERVAQHAGFMECAGDDVWNTESPIVEGLARQAGTALRRMQEAGAGRLLTGQWGDQVLSDSDYLLDLLRSGRWRLLQQHLHGWGMSARQLAVRAARDVASRHLPSSVKFLARRAGAGGGGCASEAPWFTRRFQSVLRERATYAPLNRPPGSSHAFALYRQTRLGYHLQCLEWNERRAGTYDLDIAFPYLDCDLLQFLMSIPGDMQSHDGIPRGLMRGAMRGIVPDVIVDRRSKGEFTHLTNESIERDFAAISELLGPSALAVQFGYIDGPVLRKALVEWRAAIRTADNAILANRLIDLCGFELLLRRFFGASEEAMHATTSRRVQ